MKTLILVLALILNYAVADAGKPTGTLNNVQVDKMGITHFKISWGVSSVYTPSTGGDTLYTPGPSYVGSKFEVIHCGRTTGDTVLISVENVSLGGAPVWTDILWTGNTSVLRTFTNTNGEAWIRKIIIKSNTGSVPVVASIYN